MKVGDGEYKLPLRILIPLALPLKHSEYIEQRSRAQRHLALPEPDRRGPMTNPAFPRTPSHLHQKKVRVLLRGGSSLEGVIHIPEGMPLLNFLGVKRYFLNLTSVQQGDGTGSAETLEHLSIRLSNVVWVIPLEGTLHISTASAPTGASRTVELQLVDDYTLKVDLNIAEEQRMSDYLDANSGFVPLFSAMLGSRSQVIDRLAVNHEAILAIRELHP